MLPNWQNVQRILVVQGGSYQNLIETLPTLQKFRQLQPSVSISLMVPSHNSYSHLSWIDEILVHEGLRTKFADASLELTLISKLSQYSFDAAVICTDPGKSPYPLAYICYLAGIPIRIGQSQEFGGGVLSHSLTLDDLDDTITHSYLAHPR